MVEEEEDDGITGVEMHLVRTNLTLLLLLRLGKGLSKSETIQKAIDMLVAMTTNKMFILMRAFTIHVDRLRKINWYIIKKEVG